jgi:hypothetical protein
MPSHTVTALAVSTVDQTCHLDRAATAMAVGLCLFSCHAVDRVVRFAMRSSVTGPCDFPGDLLGWLDQHLPEEGVLTGYRVADDMLPVLERLPGAAGSHVLAILTGDVPRLVIDLAGVAPDGRTSSLADACRDLAIPVSSRDAADRFVDWSFGRTQALHDALQVDAIATLRLCLRRIRDRTALGREVDAVLMPALRRWLRASDLPAARMHCA